MKRNVKKLMALGLAALMACSMAGCNSAGAKSESTTAPAKQETGGTDSGESAKKESESTDSGQPVTIKITWWGGQTRHEYTQKLLDLYSKEHPNVTFEAVPSGWDGYFDKLATQAASGAMPDIVQMDYLYITTYSKNNSLADLQPFMDDGTIDVSNMSEALVNTGKIDGKMTGFVASTSFLSFGYNPKVFEEAGLSEPDSSWTWSDFIKDSKEIKDKTGKLGSACGPVDDANIFHYWVRQHGKNLFSDDKKKLGYDDDQICADYFKMWADLMDTEAAPNPDAYAAIQTLGQEAGPVITGEAGGTFDWNNYAARMSKVNEGLKMVTPPMADSGDSKGLWMKPGMFWSVAESSKVKKEAAEFINWIVNSEEANDIIMAERGTPVSSKVREHMVSAGNLSEQQKAMFQATDDAIALCGETPDPDPVGMAEINTALKNAAYSVFYGQISPEEGAAKFRTDAEAILSRNN